MLPTVKAKLTGRRSESVDRDRSGDRSLPGTAGDARIGALADECPLASGEGGFIRDGFSAELDALRELAHGGKQWIARYQAQEIERTGIPTLKVGFNKVFGYYIEITQRPSREDSGRLHPQADDQERRAVHHAGVEGI